MLANRRSLPKSAFLPFERRERAITKAVSAIWNGGHFSTRLRSRPIGPDRGSTASIGGNGFPTLPTPVREVTFGRRAASRPSASSPIGMRSPRPGPAHVLPNRRHALSVLGVTQGGCRYRASQTQALAVFGVTQVGCRYRASQTPGRELAERAILLSAS